MQGQGRGDGVRTQGSRNGHRRGKRETGPLIMAHSVVKTIYCVCVKISLHKTTPV